MIYIYMYLTAFSEYIHCYFKLIIWRIKSVYEKLYKSLHMFDLSGICKSFDAWTWYLTTACCANTDYTKMHKGLWLLLWLRIYLHLEREFSKYLSLNSRPTTGFGRDTTDEKVDTIKISSQLVGTLGDQEHHSVKYKNKQPTGNFPATNKKTDASNDTRSICKTPDNRFRKKNVLFILK